MIATSALPVPNELDFAQRPRIVWFGYGLLVLALVSSAALLRESIALRYRATELKASLAQWERRATPPLLQDQNNPLSARRRQFIEQDLLRPWQQVFDSIEQAHQPQIQLLAIEPRANTGRLTITAQTDDMKRALAYCDALARAGLQDVRMQSHQVMAELPRRPVQFVVGARWANPIAANAATKDDP